uniref:Putative secreted protein n=1 Tax=Anopheles marajoara TaxID=58244 RepID=A0A2M4CA49_9DIPT
MLIFEYLLCPVQLVVLLAPVLVFRDLFTVRASPDPKGKKILFWPEVERKSFFGGGWLRFCKPLALSGFTFPTGTGDENVKNFSLFGVI